MVLGPGGGHVMDFGLATKWHTQEVECTHEWGTEIGPHLSQPCS